MYNKNIKTLNYDNNMTPVTNTGATSFSIGKKEPDFHLVEANINFLKESSEGKKITTGTANVKAVNIHCYSNVEKLRKDFNFHDNGFQYCALSSTLLQSLSQFSAEPFKNKNRFELIISANKFIASWGRENGIIGTTAPLAMTYRSTNPEDQAIKAFFFAHVDYDANDMPNTWEINKNAWKANIQRFYGPLSDGEYANLKINAMVNLWMPLNELPTINTLALMDISSSDNLSKELRPALTPGKTREQPITSLGLCANLNQKWVIQNVMSKGNGVIFQTTKTPHTAIDIADRFQGQQYDPSRRSVEIRFVFLDQR